MNLAVLENCRSSIHMFVNETINWQIGSSEVFSILIVMVVLNCAVYAVFVTCSIILMKAVTKII